MPMYEVHHSYPLNQVQKHQLANAITYLHSRTFVTPSFFVHVNFISHNASDQSYFVAGEPSVTSTNRIAGFVRTSPARTKSDFDNLAAKIESAWYDVVNGEMIEEGKDKGKRKAEVDQTERDREAKKLLVVRLTGMLATREQGITIPEAGKEGEWFKANMKWFKEQADFGDEGWKGMIEECESREDLKKMIG